MNRYLLLLVSSIMLLSCSSFERHRQSGYADGPRSLPVQVSEPTSNLSLETELKILENRLTHQKDLEQYSKALPFLRGKEERVRFLKKPDFEARQAYLREIDLAARSAETLTTYRPIVDSGDIALGMTQELVRRAWGEPEKIEVSGNTAFRNERWRYQKLVPSQDGYRTERKTVYFDSGQVVGWELE